MLEIFKGKTILITGGTGFLGNALASKLLEYEPNAIRLFSNSEVEHYQTQKRIQDDRIRHFLGDVRDYPRLVTACSDADIVIHCAALKRIDLIEYNVMDAIKTNVDGTMNLVRACLKQKVPKAVFISTDKACSPVNSYGATKMLGERIFIESNYNKGKSQTALIAVRYGNVLNSTGSVVPFFKETIKSGKDIPITDERMTRFIISEERAVKEVVDSIKHGIGGEIFVPKLKSHTIMDLAHVLISHYGKNNKIKTVGIRPGEKIHECMINNIEVQKTFEFEDHYVILPQISGIESEKAYPYLKGKKKVSFKEYCSNKFLVEQAELKRILLKTGNLS